MAKLSRKELTDAVETVERHLREIREIIRRPLEGEFARGQLTGPQASVMQAIFHSQGMTLKDLCRRVGLAHSTTSGIVDRLAVRGLLERKPGASDRRFTVIVATPGVREFMAKQAPRLLAQPLVAALKRMSAAERDLILSGLETLRKALEQAAGTTKASWISRARSGQSRGSPSRTGRRRDPLARMDILPR